MAVSKRLRYEILRRDNHACRYCGAAAPDVKLTVDHVVPTALGGSDAADNLVTACGPCNSGKTSSSPDANLVADISDDALRWAKAMEQAADELRQQHGPKLEYRAAFENAWNGWTYEHDGKKKHFTLPDGWKTSLDTFRTAGLPAEVLPDIVDKAMANKTVTGDNLFRYCCGIAWRMIDDLQSRAKKIVGVGSVPAETQAVDSVVQAALDVWSEEGGEDDSGETRDSILAGAQAARERDVAAHSILEAAQHSAWYGPLSISDSLADIEHERAMSQWRFTWLAVTGGEYPNEERTRRMERQIRDLLDADVYVRRVERAASYAGAHRSARLYFGLSEEELAVLGETASFVRAAEKWAQAFESSASRWPTDEEVSTFFRHLRRLGEDGDFWIVDAYTAAAAVGTYQDTDLTTCLPRHLSVFDAAAAPIQPAA